MDMADTAVIRQHLIDPEICIRCNTCEAICPVGAITHDDRNYVVDAGKCNLCMACISPCPTGSIDNWRVMPRVMAYTPEVQLEWEELPAELTPEQLAEAGVADGAAPDIEPAPVSLPADADGAWFHNTIYAFKETAGLAPKELFTTLYRAVIGKTSGPRAGWFLSILPRDWLIRRLRMED